MNPTDPSPDPAPTPWLALLDAALRASGGLPEARYAQLATVRPDGRPANRTVVVRGLHGPEGLVLITTDARSAKAEDLAANPWAELCWYLHDSREQFRLFGRVDLSVRGDDPLRTHVWAGLPPPTRQSFTGPPPGRPREADPSAIAGPEAERPQPPETFALLVLAPARVDHLDLRPPGHARTLFERGSCGGWVVTPLHP